MAPRILIVAPNLLYGDPNPRSIRARRLARGFVAAGAEVEVLTWWSGEEPAPERLDGLEGARLTALRSPFPFAAKAEGAPLDGLGAWIEAALAELDGRPPRERPALVYAIGVPVGAIIAGGRIAERTGAALVADLGDPWEAEAERERAERDRALGAAAALVTTTPELAADLGAHLPDGAETLIAPNGGEIRLRPGRAAGEAPAPPLFIHLGAINPGRVDPVPSYAALAALEAEGRLELRSHTNGFWPGLERLPHPHLPLLPHEEAIELLARSSAELVLGNTNRAQLPSKAFELACTETWALCVCELEDDPVRALLGRTGHAVAATANDEASIRAAAEEILAREARGERPAPDPSLSWQSRVDQIRGLIDELTARDGP